MISIIKDGRHVSTFNAEEVKKIDTKIYILTFRTKEYMDDYLKKCPFDIVNQNEILLTASIKINTSQYQQFIDSLIGVKLNSFSEQPYTLQDYFMSFYKEDKVFGGLGGGVGNKK